VNYVRKSLSPKYNTTFRRENPQKVVCFFGKVFDTE